MYCIIKQNHFGEGTRIKEGEIGIMEMQNESKNKENKVGTNKSSGSLFSMVSEWFKSPLIRNTIVISSVFALIIHVLYYFPAPFDFFVHKWEAGDILTYVSTIALSLLAVWQNQKFKEESDQTQAAMERQNKEAQDRLERISMEANELSVISRIIDQEDKYLSKLEEAALAFLNASSGGKLLAAINKAIDSNDPMAVSGADMEMRHAYDRLMAIYMSGMKTDGTELLTLMESASILYEEASKVFTKIFAEKDYHCLSIDTYSVTYDRAENALQVFLFERRKLMYRILTEKMSLEQVRAIYSTFEGSISRF